MRKKRLQIAYYRTESGAKRYASELSRSAPAGFSFQAIHATASGHWTMAGRWNSFVIQCRDAAGRISYAAKRPAHFNATMGVTNAR